VYNARVGCLPGCAVSLFFLPEAVENAGRQTNQDL
jgi:hypothetical protein